MATLNYGNLYAASCSGTQFSKLDDVDVHIQFLKTCDEYDEVKEYLMEHFGDINGERWIDFAEYNKECYLKMEDNRIEFCSLKNHKQYYGKGWLKVNNDA